MSFGKRDGASSTNRKAAVEMMACFHLVRLDKADGPVGITLDCTDLAPSDNRRRVGGVQILTLDRKGSAYREGLRVGDVVMAINDKPVNVHSEAMAAINGDKLIELRVWGMRPARTKTLWKGQSDGRIGLTMSDNESGPGAVVSYCIIGQQAQRLGLQVGDVVLAINEKIIKQHSDAIELIENGPDGELVFTFVPTSDEARPEAFRKMEA